MPEQLLLEGIEAAPPPVDRLFLAIKPDLASAQRIAQQAMGWARDCRMMGAPLEADRLHITLHHLGDHAGMPRSLVMAACEAAATVTMPPFDVSFDHVASFSRRHAKQPFVLLSRQGTDALMRFRHAVRLAMLRAGLGQYETDKFTPHVTLLYDRRAASAMDVAPVTWTVREFMLVHSLIGAHRHTQLASWPLQP